MRILITGAGGFLGKRLTSLLAKSGHEVFAVLRKSIPSIDAHYFFSNKIIPIIQDLERLDTSCLPNNIDVMFTIAQSSNFRNFPQQAEEIFKVNTVSNLQLLNWALDSGVRKIIHASSGGVYGVSNRASDDMLIENNQLETSIPLGFYLGTKLCSEIIFQNYANLFDSMSILRPFFIYGPGQRDDMFIARLIKSIKNETTINLQGENGLSVNPVYVDDAAEAFKSALELTGFNIINVAGPNTVALRGLCEKIGEYLGKKPIFKFADGIPANYVADTSLQIKTFGPQKFSIENGLKLCI